MAESIVVQCAAIAERNANHRLLRRSSRFGNRLRHFARFAVTEAGAALAVADDHERREAEALAALHRLGDAIDVDELLDQLFATILVVAASTTVVAASTATATIATATATAPAAPAARATALRLVVLRLRGRLLLGLGRGRFGNRCRLDRVGIGFVALLLLVLHSRTPVRLRGQRRRGPSLGHGTGSRRDRRRPSTRQPSWRARRPPCRLQPRCRASRPSCS